MGRRYQNVFVIKPARASGPSLERKQMTYTDNFDSKLIETHWLASVSHHHFWFADFRELVAFQNSPEFDIRMTISSPAN
jgi:hypothetical protein